MCRGAAGFVGPNRDLNGGAPRTLLHTGTLFTRSDAAAVHDGSSSESCRLDTHSRIKRANHSLTSVMIPLHSLPKGARNVSKSSITKLSITSSPVLPGTRDHPTPYLGTQGTEVCAQASMQGSVSTKLRDALFYQSNRAESLRKTKSNVLAGETVLASLCKNATLLALSPVGPYPRDTSRGRQYPLSHVLSDGGGVGSVLRRDRGAISNALCRD